MDTNILMCVCECTWHKNMWEFGYNHVYWMKMARATPQLKFVGQNPLLWLLDLEARCSISCFILMYLLAHL